MKSSARVLQKKKKHTQKDDGACALCKRQKAMLKNPPRQSLSSTEFSVCAEHISEYL